MGLELEATEKINRRSFLDRSEKVAAGTAMATSVPTARLTGKAQIDRIASYYNGL